MQDTRKNHVQNSINELNTGIHESNQTYKERETIGESGKLISIGKPSPKNIKNTILSVMANMGTEKHRNNKVDFFFKYSKQLEAEKKKLLSRIKGLEQENQMLTERFRGSIEQREQIKKSSDKVMNMLANLNGMIDRFVNLSPAEGQANKSEKAILMDDLCREKRKFDEKILGIKRRKKSEAQTIPSSHLQSEEDVSLQNSLIQEELNKSIKKLEELTNEVKDSMVQLENHPYTIEIDNQQLNSFAVNKKKIQSK